MTDRLTARLLDLPPVRRAGFADAPVIARVHVAAWRETYVGLLPPARAGGHRRARFGAPRRV